MARINHVLLLKQYREQYLLLWLLHMERTVETLLLSLSASKMEGLILVLPLLPGLLRMHNSIHPIGFSLLYLGLLSPL